MTLLYLSRLSPVLLEPVKHDPMLLEPVKHDPMLLEPVKHDPVSSSHSLFQS